MNYLFISFIIIKFILSFNEVRASYLEENDPQSKISSISFLPDEILIHMSSFLEGKDFINFKMSSKELNKIAQDESLVLTLNDTDKILSLIEKSPLELRKRANRSDPKLVSNILINLAIKNYHNHYMCNTAEERKESLFLWKRFLQLTHLAKELGNHEANQLIQKHIAAKLDALENYDPIVDENGNDLLDEISIKTFRFEQCAYVVDTVRKKLIECYELGHVVRQDLERAIYWKNFNLQSYLWEGK